MEFPQLGTRLEDLQQLTASALLDSHGSPEKKIEILCLLCDQFLPLCVVDESAHCPHLTAVFGLVDKIFTLLTSLQDPERTVVLLSKCVTLINHIQVHLLAAVKYAGYQNESPRSWNLASIPSLVPNILYKTFNHCKKEKYNARSLQEKYILETLMIKSKEALESFCTLMESRKELFVFEEELEMLIDLCSSLFKFGHVLVAEDYKLVCRCWGLFCRITSHHSARLQGNLDMDKFVAVLISQSNQCLHLLLEESHQIPGSNISEKSKNASKEASLVAYLVKVLVKLVPYYQGSLSTNLEQFLIFILRLIDTDYKTPDYFSIQLAEKLRRDIFGPQHYSYLLRLYPVDTLSAVLLEFWNQGFITKILLAKPFPAVVLIVKLLEEMRSNGSEMQSNGDKSLLSLLLQLFSYSKQAMVKIPSRGGISIVGKPIEKVDNYEWVLTHLCAWISTATLSEFILVERCLFSQIEKPIGWSALLICDVWCFVARYGTSRLAYSHIMLLTKIILKLPPQSFTSAGFWIKVLFGRLFNCLASEEQNLWMENFSPSEPKNLVLFALINLQKVKGDIFQKNRQLIYDMVYSHVEEFMSGAWTSACHPILTGYSLVISTQLYKEGVGVDWLPRTVCLIWRKFVVGPFSPSKVYWEAELFSHLVEATCAVVTNQDSTYLSVIVSILKAALKMGKKTVYVLGGLIRIVSELPAGRGVDKDKVGLYKSILSLSIREPHLHMEALQSFAEFANSAEDEVVIDICGDESVKQSVQEFLDRNVKEVNIDEGEKNEKLCDYKDDLYEIIIYETSKDISVDDEPRRKVSSLIPHLRIGSCPRKRNFIREKEVNDNTEMDDIIRRLEKDTVKIRKCVVEDKENQLRGNRENRIAHIISVLQPLVTSQSNQVEEIKELIFSQSP